MDDKRSIAGGVVGIVGAVFALIGGLGLALCSDLLGATTYKVISWVFGVGAAIVALTGAVFCFRKALIGGIILAIAAVFILIESIVVDFTVMNIIAMVLVALGAVFSFVFKS